jgi:hypothetical protein
MIESSKPQRQQFYAAKVGDKVLALRDEDWNEAFVKSIEEDGYTVTFKGDANLIKVAKNHIKVCAVQLDSFQSNSLSDHDCLCFQEADRTSFSDCIIA